MEGIRITLETLYDCLRNEKKREDLQKLEPSFFIDVVCYLREKKALLEIKQEKENPFAAGEKEKVEAELRSIKRILKELYEKREKKIIDIALNRSKTGSDIIDTSAMLREEKIFYTHLLKILDYQRKGILLNLYNAELPGIEEHTTLNTALFTTQPTTIKGKPENGGRIRFLHAVPRFVWKDLKTYGPFSEGEETDIFPEVAELLVRKGRAEWT